MGTRDYYVIGHYVEYDGYDWYIDYVTDNLKDACNIYNFIFEKLKDEVRSDEDADDHNLSCEYTDPIRVFSETPFEKLRNPYCSSWVNNEWRDFYSAVRMTRCRKKDIVNDWYRQAYINQQGGNNNG